MSRVPQRKLLLADDSVTIQKVVNLTFADEGIEVITVGDGDSAMAKFSENAPDLVMADVNMPGLSGYEICEKIRQSAAADTPVILLVGSFEPFDEAEANRVGANDYLTKPFQSIRQLVNKVNELLDTSAQKNGADVATDNEDFSEAKTLDSISIPSDYSPAQTNESTPQVSGYDETDDEMIETSSGAGGYIFDESAKFQTREVDETPETPVAAEQYVGIEQPTAMQTETEEVITEESASAESESSLSENQERETFDYAPTIPAEESREESKTETSRANDLFADDDDFLEIPFDEEEEEEETEEETANADTAAAASANESVTPEPYEEPAHESAAETVAKAQEPEAPAQSFAEIPIQTTANKTTENSSTIQTGQLSSEMIEAIAQRVVEKLSDRAVKEVAWEVVPQHAELIIKKMVEEKMKE